MAYKIETADQRRQLAPRREPYFVPLMKGLGLGYRRITGKTGTWIAQRREGQWKKLNALGPADDIPGVGMDYHSAVEATLKWAVMGRGGREAAAYTVGQACAAYVEDLRVRGKSSASVVEGSFSRYVETHGIRLRRLADLHAQELKQWHDWVSRRPRRRSAKVQASDEENSRRRRANANRVLSQLKSALNLAYADGWVSTREWDRVRPFRGVEVPRNWFLRLEEIPRFVEACQPEEFRELALAALYTGARYGELCRLTRESFLPDARAIHIARSKSGKPRHIPLAGDGVPLFQDLAARAGPGDLLLKHPSGRAWHRSEQRRPFREAMERAGLLGGSFHGLRHTFASHAVMRGWSLSVVAQVLGHTSTRMVEKHYGHLAPSHVVKTVREMPADYGVR